MLVYAVRNNQQEARTMGGEGKNPVLPDTKGDHPFRGGPKPERVKEFSNTCQLNDWLARDGVMMEIIQRNVAICGATGNEGNFSAMNTKTIYVVWYREK